MKLRIVKKATQWGNSAGVHLPKGWLRKQVRVRLMDESEKTKKSGQSK